MRPSLIALALAVAAPGMALGAHAQRHSGHASPPTAQAPPPPPAPIVPASTGLGAIQFVPVNFGVPAPQSLTRQLRFEDDRTRGAALSAIGAPGQYLQRGHIPMPRSIDLELVPMGAADELDALLTVELDQHIVTAILMPVDGNWKRIATLIFPTPFNDASTTPSTWVRTSRALVQPDRYRAVFHASSGSLGGNRTANYAENEAHVRIINNRAVVTMSFESTARECVTPNTPSAAAPHANVKPGCTLTHRWFQSDPTDPTHHFDLITATGQISLKDAMQPLADSRTMMMSRLRTFSCQPFIFSETTQHFEPTAAPGPCRNK